MHAHLTVQLDSIHFDHNHEGFFARVTHGMGSALEWATGPGMSEQQRVRRELAEARNERYLRGSF